MLQNRKGSTWENVKCTRQSKRYLKKDGSILWGSLTASPVRDHAGKVLYTIALIEDITERKMAENALMESKEQYQQIFESFVDLYAQTDKNGIIKAVSPSTYSMTGWNRKN